MRVKRRQYPKDDMVRVQVSQRTKVGLEAIAYDKSRSVANLCILVIERELDKLQSRNDAGTSWAASAPVSPDPRTARINIRCHRRWKEKLQRQAATSGQSLSAYCNDLFERFTAAELGRMT